MHLVASRKQALWPWSSPTLPSVCGRPWTPQGQSVGFSLPHALGHPYISFQDHRSATHSGLGSCWCYLFILGRNKEQFIENISRKCIADNVFSPSEHNLQREILPRPSWSVRFGAGGGSLDFTILPSSLSLCLSFGSDWKVTKGHYPPAPCTVVGSAEGKPPCPSAGWASLPSLCLLFLDHFLPSKVDLYGEASGVCTVRGKKKKSQEVTVIRGFSHRLDISVLETSLSSRIFGLG